VERDTVVQHIAWKNELHYFIFSETEVDVHANSKKIGEKVGRVGD